MSFLDQQAWWPEALLVGVGIGVVAAVLIVAITIGWRKYNAWQDHLKYMELEAAEKARAEEEAREAWLLVRKAQEDRRRAMPWIAAADEAAIEREKALRVAAERDKAAERQREAARAAAQKARLVAEEAAARSPTPKSPRTLEQERAEVPGRELSSAQLTFGLSPLYSLSPSPTSPSLSGGGKTKSGG